MGSKDNNAIISDECILAALLQIFYINVEKQKDT